MEALNLDQILARARVVIRDDNPHGSSEACLGATAYHGAASRVAATSQRCYLCSGPNHFARDCLIRHQGEGVGGEAMHMGGGWSRRRVKCYRCGGLGHYASACPGNERGEEASAPASSLAGQ
ncbi:hypothetical protein GWK47_020994 [Chionoecetes opilio]|uniref:CCHC-type domain-containing protein n=1 Tax=Chionoecetes opilio TaxID=41210 RepID=A0A8J4XPE8_CHIOP|nr:hypothetical protein GWK47_020994 [Chionoecetes opilio]